MMSKEEPSDRLFTEIVFSATSFIVIGSSGDITHELGQKMTTSDL